MLTSLELSNNNFVGTIPVEFSNLKKLTTLNLSGNLMDGVISKDVLNSDMWANLTTINVNPQRDNHALTFEGGEVFVSEITLDLSEGMVGRESALDLGIHLYPANATSKEIYVEVEDEDICRVYNYPNGPRFAGGSELGETTVTIKVKGSDAYATCKIVNMGILYDQTTVYLESGETFTPTITKFGDVDKYKWYWYSNDESVATVNKDGKLTAVETGETYVYVLIEGVGSFGYNVKVNKQVAESETNQDFTGQQGQWDN